MPNGHWTEAFQENESTEQRNKQDDFDLRVKIYDQLDLDEIKASKKRFQQTKQHNDDTNL